MAGPVRVLLGALVIGVSLLAAVRYHDADFTIEREVELGPPPAALGQTGEFGTATILIRCTDDGAGWWSEATGRPMFYNDHAPSPIIDESLCEEARLERGRRAVAVASVAGLAGGWLIVSGLRKEPAEGLQAPSPST